MYEQEFFCQKTGKNLTLGISPATLEKVGNGQFVPSPCGNDDNGKIFLRKVDESGFRMHCIGCDVRKDVSKKKK